MGEGEASLTLHVDPRDHGGTREAPWDPCGRDRIGHHSHNTNMSVVYPREVRHCSTMEYRVKFLSAVCQPHISKTPTKRIIRSAGHVALASRLHVDLR
jgi:hypothetical protein